jgi:hypothetical protein
MPRKSGAAKLIALTTTGTRQRLMPPPFLLTDEKSLFVELAARNAHLTPTDTPMLAAYCQAIVKTHHLAQGDDVGSWEKAGRLAMALARTLRLAPISGTHPERLGRQRRDAQPSPIAEYFAQREAEGDDDE